MFDGTFTVAGLTITIIDIVVVLLLLAFFFVGMKKGFVNQLFGFIGTIAVIVGAIALAGVVGGWLNGLFGNAIHSPIDKWVSGLGADTTPNLFTEVLNWEDAATRDAYIPVVLEQMGLPGLAVGLLAKAFDKVFAGFGTAALSDVLADTLTSWVMTAIAFILLLIVFGILLAILKRLFRGIKRVKVFGAMDKILGCVLGLAKAYVFFSVIFTIFLLIPGNFPLIEQINAHIEASFITKFLYTNNPLSLWLLSLIAG